MEEPVKPFACTIPDCGQTFTNEDHLQSHTKKHDMVLQFGNEHKTAFVADQTPTPTRFIRTCEEVGLFQDLQNVNPFDEGFKRAMESKQCILEAITTPSSTDDLHTPQMFPLIDPADSVYSTSNQRNITISRSSSDESGAIKELETTTISKLTNRVTTISRVVEKHEDSNDDAKKDVRKDSVSYNNVTSNVIKVLNNVEMKQHEEKKEYLIVPPIMSQQSIDNVVDSLTSDFAKDKKDDYEVTIKLPSGQKIRLTSTEEKTPKEILKKVLTDKSEIKTNSGPITLPSAIPFGNGTLIPVSIVNTMTVIPKLPLKVFDKRPVKRKRVEGNIVSKSKEEMDRESRKAASKRHREKDKQVKMRINLENNELKKFNDRLKAENAELKSMILQHMKKCPDRDDFRNLHSTEK